MQSKLLQKTNKSDEVLVDQREETDDSSMPLEPSRRKPRSPWLLTPRPPCKHSSQSGA